MQKKNLRLPILTANTLWHWGFLDESKKRERGVSFEGDLFSMSACPNAWLQIGRYGGKPIFKTTSAIKLIDSHSIFLSKSHHAKRLQEQIIQWGIDKGLLEKRDVYEFHYEDEDGEAFMEFNTLEEALLESGDDPDLIEIVSRVIATDELKRLHGFKPQDVVGHDYALLEWAKTIPGIDGVYWDDTLRPSSLSAPRAGLFALPSLVECNPSELLPDKECLDQIGEVVWQSFSRHLEPSNEPGFP